MSFAAALAALALGGAAAGGWVPEPPWAFPAAELDIQSLFRLRYEGPRGSGSQRVVLRLRSPRRFLVQGSDPLGRTRWSLEARDGEIVFQDHGADAYCRAGRDFSLPEPGLESVAVIDLPHVLLGRLPAPPAAAVAAAPGRLEFSDALGRRWTSRLSDAGPAAWALWRAGEPTLWWTGAGAEGVLSARRGTQLRWRRTAREPLAPGALDPPLPAAGYLEVGCSAFYPGESPGQPD